VTPLDVLTIGEAMVAFHSDGALVQGGRHTARVAGAESNVAIGLARLGHSVAWAGRVGGDEFGRMVLRELRAEGVDLSLARVDPDRPTGLMFVEHRTADVSRVDYRRAGSAGSALDVDDVRAALSAASPRMLHLTGITPALSRSARRAVGSAVEHASATGIAVSLDVNHRTRLWDRAEARDALAPLVPHVTHLVASDDELALVSDVRSDAPEDEVVGRLLDRGVRDVAVKRGPRGASVITHAGRWDADPLPVTSVDVLGAGDAFSAGFLSGVLDGLTPQGCLRRGAAAGAWTVASRGDWEGAATRADLALLLAHTPGTTLR
jgi:2-dehydro-3-deoxygluconokinase